MLERRIDKARKAAKGDRKYQREAELLERLLAHLDAGGTARSFVCDGEEREIIAASELLTLKPVIYAANMDEKTFAAGFAQNPYLAAVRKHAEAEGSEVLPICAKAEQEIAELDGEDRALFLAELGLERSGLDRLIQCSYALLGLISYLTAGPDEVRAWTIGQGTKAPQAAGKIHSDFERGFIRAEIVAFDDLAACGSMAAARERGLVRSEGKDYVVRDGDVVLFRFNV
jgi:GTP-binding protein YchF